MKQNNADFAAREQYDQGAIVGAAHATDGREKCIPPGYLGKPNWCRGYSDGYDKVSGGRLTVVKEVRE